jgi:molecular chaperone GrpE
MDQQKKKIEIEDKRAGDADASAQAAPLLEETGISEDVALDWQAKATEYLDLARRKEAELRNALRRGEEDRKAAVSNAIEGLIHDLFPALDALTQAVGAFKGAPEGDNKLVDGVRGTLKLLQKGLSKHGIEVIAESGVPFDGHLHQALQVEDGDVQEETVAEVYSDGYRIGDRVLKPALVKVVKPS